MRIVGNRVILRNWVNERRSRKTGIALRVSACPAAEDKRLGGASVEAILRLFDLLLCQELRARMGS
jgi:hypothetical protein